MGLLRFCVVFLLGLGAALGAYATGGLDYVARQHYFHSWYAPSSYADRDMVLRVSGTALNGFCTERYAIDNQSGRRVLVIFSPGRGDPRLASDDRGGAYGYGGPVDGRYGDAQPYAGEEFRPAENDYPRGDADPRDAQARLSNVAPDQAPYPDEARYQAVNDQAPPPVEVAPGESKIIGRANDARIADAGPDDQAMAPGRCGNRVVRLQLTDCARDDGACVTETNYPGGANHYQGDE